MSFPLFSQNTADVYDRWKISTKAVAHDDTTVLGLEDMSFPIFSDSKVVAQTYRLIEEGAFKIKSDEKALWTKVVVRIIEDFDDLANLDKDKVSFYHKWNSIADSNDAHCILEYFFEQSLKDSIGCYSFDLKKRYTNVEIQNLLRGGRAVSYLTTGDTVKHFGLIAICDPHEPLAMLVIEKWDLKEDFSLSSKVVALSSLSERDLSNGMGMYFKPYPMGWFLFD